MAPPNGQTSFYGTGARFAATRWSIVRAAGGDNAATDTRRALGELIQAYWFPLYAFVRRQGAPPAQAEDVVQDFLTSLLERRDLARVDSAKGKFRSFLLASMKHFLSKERDKAAAMKRGGGASVIQLDALDAEARYAIEPADDMTPERLFDRRWALAVLDNVLARMRQEHLAAGTDRLYDAIEPCLTGRAAVHYAEVSRELKMAEGAVRMAVHRLRRRYRDLLKEEIAQTVDSPEDVENEISYLLNCL